MKTFNIIICGTGGQGIITLLKILTKAALIEGFNVKSSELHGLSQRGGSVKTHIKIGKKIFSPLILPGQADFLLGLEAQETLRAKNFANSNTVFLVNKHLIPIPGANLKLNEIENNIRNISKQAYFVDAISITQKKLKNSMVAGVFLLAYASYKNFIPVSLKSITQSIKQIIKPEYQEINQKAIELAKKF